MAKFSSFKRKRFTISTRVFAGNVKLFTPGIKRPRVRRRAVAVRGVTQMVKP